MPVLTLFKSKPKRSRKTYLMAQLDAIMSKRIRERDGYVCRRCGRRDKVFHHHIFTKQRLSTRFVPENGVALCFHCHRWAHAAGEEFREWVRGWMGERQYDELYLRSQMRAVFKEIDLEWLLRDMRQKG